MRLINIRPDQGTRLMLAALPFAILALAYLIGSALRLADNPGDKLLPSLAAMGRAVDPICRTCPRPSATAATPACASATRGRWGAF